MKKEEKVNSIKIIIDYQVKSFKNLFIYCKNISSIFFKKFNRIKITDMNSMFYNCSSLKELNISNFNTANVKNMNYMFNGCLSLKELKTIFSINEKTETKYMFIGCPDEVEKKFNENNKKLKLINV